MLAALNGDENMLAGILKHDPFVNWRDEQGRTALHLAAANGNTNCALLLLEHGGDVNAVDFVGSTPLQDLMLSALPNLETLELLLEYEADPNILDLEGIAPLHIAARKGLEDFVEMLLRYGAHREQLLDLLEAQENGLLYDERTEEAEIDTYASNAVTSPKVAISGLFVRTLENRPTPTPTSVTPTGGSRLVNLLHVAARWGDCVSVTSLLKEGAQLDGQTVQGSTALLAAVTGDHLDCVVLLCEKGANVNLPGADGRTPLHVACMFGRTAIAQILLDAGADANVADNKNLTAAALAMAAGHQECARIVMDRGGRLRAEHADETMYLDTPQEFHTPLHSVPNSPAGAHVRSPSKQITPPKALQSPVIRAALSARATHSWQIEWRQIQMKDFIGRGGYGEVNRAMLWGTTVAVKVLLKQDEKTQQDFENEVSFLSSVRHPNVVLFMGACLESPNLCIVTEFVSKGSLHKVLTDSKIVLTLAHVVKIAMGVARGMNYLHQLQPAIIHRDLKSPNILIDEHFTPKVADFGIAKVKQGSFINTICGSPAWMAPEILRNEPYTEACDIYSFGVVLWELVTRRAPFETMHPIQVIAAKAYQQPPQTLHVPNTTHPALASLMMDCWHDDQSRRPSFAEVIVRLEPLEQTYPLV
eukprot:TRINITY_DN1263_c0_g1_i1.p2 TRINITY_DN1263_c0_g1~~TRINITY_DN1263_c0_g1_i1.p2  ORF type:complete len:646 (+),score=135.39 TRINITY_DN1263_c0_g1_i1:4049-5986(+)